MSAAGAQLGLRDANLTDNCYSPEVEGLVVDRNRTAAVEVDRNLGLEAGIRAVDLGLDSKT